MQNIMEQLYNGAVVELSNGDRYFVLADHSINSYGSLAHDSFMEDGKYIGDGIGDFDITAVFQNSDIAIYTEALLNTNLFEKSTKIM